MQEALILVLFSVFFSWNERHLLGQLSVSIHGAWNVFAAVSFCHLQTWWIKAALKSNFEGLAHMLSWLSGAVRLAEALQNMLLDVVLDHFSLCIIDC